MILLLVSSLYVTKSKQDSVMCCYNRASILVTGMTLQFLHSLFLSFLRICKISAILQYLARFVLYMALGSLFHPKFKYVTLFPKYLYFNTFLEDPLTIFISWSCCVTLAPITLWRYNSCISCFVEIHTIFPKWSHLHKGMNLG